MEAVRELGVRGAGVGAPTDRRPRPFVAPPSSPSHASRAKSAPSPVGAVHRHRPCSAQPPSPVSPPTSGLGSAGAGPTPGPLRLDSTNPLTPMVHPGIRPASTSAKPLRSRTAQIGGFLFFGLLTPASAECNPQPITPPGPLPQGTLSYGGYCFFALSSSPPSSTWGGRSRVSRHVYPVPAARLKWTQPDVEIVVDACRGRVYLHSITPPGPLPQGMPSYGGSLFVNRMHGAASLQIRFAPRTHVNRACETLRLATLSSNARTPHAEVVASCEPPSIANRTRSSRMIMSGYFLHALQQAPTALFAATGSTDTYTFINAPQHTLYQHHVSFRDPLKLERSITNTRVFSSFGLGVLARECWTFVTSASPLPERRKASPIRSSNLRANRLISARIQTIPTRPTPRPRVGSEHSEASPIETETGEILLSVYPQRTSS
jgi:hypothetical protein